MNIKYLKKDLNKITVKLITNVIEFAYIQGYNSHAPLGCSGETYILYGSSRNKEISLRLHSGDVEMLITDSIGNFLFYGGFDTSLLPISFIANQYYSIIQNTKYLLNNTVKNTSISELDKEKMREAANIFNSFI